jgi:hypothetical protein
MIWAAAKIKLASHKVCSGMPFYIAFGLRLSANRPIPGLVSCPSLARWDVDLWLGEASGEEEADQHAPRHLSYVSPDTDPQGNPVLTLWKPCEGGDGADYHFVYANGIAFRVDTPGSAVVATWPLPFTLEDALTYLLGPILGFVLRLRGVTALHGSVVAIDGQAFALSGATGAGKSTTAAAFAGRGFPVLSDDIAPLVWREDRVFIEPGYPQVRLWPDSVQMLYGSPEALPLLTPNWDKRFLDVAADHPTLNGQPFPLAAIYVLDERWQGLTSPIIELLAPREAFMALTVNTYANLLLEKPMRVREFLLLQALVERVPVKRITLPAGPVYLPALCDGILADFAAVAQAEFAPRSDSHV